MTLLGSLDGYNVHGVLGRGGMGLVYSATHRSSGIDVALKVMTAAFTQEPTFVRAFRREIELLARLDHPSIVRILDFGEASAVSGELEVRPGNPYLVLERIDGAPLSQTHIADAEDLRVLMQDVLAALAHAHGRGVLHRDIKPSNILRTADGRYKLIDFGLAMLGQNHGELGEPLLGGTVGYAAKEQFVRGGTLGPPTDIYAVGILARKMYSTEVLADAPTLLHVAGVEPCIFEPRFPLPSALRPWINKATETNPLLRFATAARALQALGASLPSTKKRAVDSLDGATLRLFSLRPQPAVGRNAEEAVLRADVDYVREAGAPRVRILHSSDDQQSAALGRTILERCTEYGLAKVAFCTNRLGNPRAEGVGPLLARLYGCAGKNRYDVLRRVHQVHHHLGEPLTWQTRAVAELISPSVLDEPKPKQKERAKIVVLGDVDTSPISIELVEFDKDEFVEVMPSFAFRNDQERIRVALRALRMLSQFEPLVLQFDDVRGDTLICRLIEAIASSELPIYSLVHSKAVDELSSLLAQPGVALMSLPALRNKDVAAFVAAQFPLAPKTLARLQETVDGDIRFCIGLLNHWSHTGAVRFIGGKFELHDGYRWPRSYADLQRQRLIGLESEFDDSAIVKVILERAACFGDAIPIEAWKYACSKVAGAGSIEDVTSAMIRHGIAIRLDQGILAFADAIHCEILQRQAREAGRHVGNARCCSAGILRTESNGAALERAAHILDDDDDAEDVARLFRRAMRAYVDEHNGLAGEELADKFVALCTDRQLSAESQAKFWASALIMGRRLRSTSMVEKIVERLQRLTAEVGPWYGGMVRYGRSACADIRGDHQEGVRELELGLSLVEGAPRWFRDYYFRHLAWLSYVIDDAASALAYTERVKNNEADWANSACFLHRLGRVDEAMDTLRMVIDRQYKLGRAAMLGMSLQNLGSYAQMKGDLDEALTLLRQAQELYEWINVDECSLVYINLALLYVARKEFAAARSLVEAKIAFVPEHQHFIVVAMHVVLLVCAIRQRDDALWDRSIGFVLDPAVHRVELRKILQETLAVAARVWPARAKQLGDYLTEQEN